MKRRPQTGRDARARRQQAEQRLASREPVAEGTQGGADAQALAHELEVHKIELQMQKEELESARIEARQAADKYAALFDFAPVGCFVLEASGVIREVNLAGAALLRLERHRVTGRPFEHFVVRSCREEFREFCRRARTSEGRGACELRLLQPGREPRDVLLGVIVTEGGPVEDYRCHLAVTDITERKCAEEKVRQLNANLEREVAEHTAELRARHEAMTRFDRAMVGRKVRVGGATEEVNKPHPQAGQPMHYPQEPEKEQP